MMAILKEVFFSSILFTLVLVSSIITLTHFFNFSKNPPTVTSECESSSEATTVLRLTTNFTYSTNDTSRVTNSAVYKKMMVRVGTELKLDINNQCPPGSLMLNRSQDFSPAHTNCPTLFIVGVRKGGTTSLYYYISKHPDFEGIMLYGPSAGETFYFGRHFERFTWEYYISLFPSGVTTGESSVENLVHKLAPSRLYKSCGTQAKVIVLLRDPIRRLESNVLMRAKLKRAEYMKSKDSKSTTSAVVNASLSHFHERVVRRTKNLNPSEWYKLTGLFSASANMVYEGLYYVHLLNWLCNFPAENILIINSEEFFKNPSTVLDVTVQFLGMKRLNMKTYKSMISLTYNKGHYDDDHRLTESDREKLLEVYDPFNKALLKLLQWNNANWLMPSSS